MKKLSRAWLHVSPRFLPFADAASPGLPLSRLLRLALFQVSVGMAGALMVGTLNRVMIVELQVAAWLVSSMVALPLLLAPWRALVGFRSDTHWSALGWRRVPYLWFGSLMQFGGLAIMPFALLVLSSDAADLHGPAWVGTAAAALAFVLVGAGLQTTQTAGLALATDLAPEATRPRVVALMYVMLLVGMLVGSLAFGALLREFSHVRLVQVVQGAALTTMLLNVVALWKQEPRGRRLPAPEARPSFTLAWRSFAGQPDVRRFLVAVGLGTAAFNMQDIVLEPYGGAVMHLGVGATSLLTALLAAGALAAFALAARLLQRGADAYRLAAMGTLAGVVAFAAVIFAAPLASPLLFRAGVLLIGFGGGLFGVGTLIAAMALSAGHNGLALGAWGAVQATAGGLAVGLGGAVRDGISALATQGTLGPALTGPAIGYSFVYHLEIALLFATLVAIGPLVKAVRPGSAGAAQATPPAAPRPFGLAEFPG